MVQMCSATAKKRGKLIKALPQIGFNPSFYNLLITAGPSKTARVLHDNIMVVCVFTKSHNFSWFSPKLSPKLHQKCNFHISDLLHLNGSIETLLERKMFRMQSSSHLDSLASSLLLSPSQADVTFVTNSATLSAHRALLLPLLPSLSSLLCFSCSPHDPLLLLLPDASSSALSSALGTLYKTRRPDELAELLGLSVKQEELIPKTSTSPFRENVWVEEQSHVKEGDVLENVLDSENREDMESIGGDHKEAEEDSANGAELENMKSDDHDEYKTKLSSEWNDMHSTGFFGAFLSGENIDCEERKESKDKREMIIEKRKYKGALLTKSEKKMFERRRCHGYKVKKTPKQDRTEAEGQFEMESESDDSSEEK